jgi:membrane protease YdiL (CAAX protease family)
MIGTFGPGIAALFAVGRESGTRGLRELFRSLVPRSLKWIAAAVLAPTSLLIISFVCAGYSVGYFNSVSMEHWIRLVAVNVPLEPLWEEVGWRGYLLPKLQSKFRGLSAAMIVGAIWGSWHLPLHVTVVSPRIGQVTYFMCFLIYVLGFSIIFTWFYNKSLGNLGVLVALHASLNATATALLGPAMAEHGLWPFVLFIIAVWAACLIVLFVAGTDLSCPRQPASLGSSPDGVKSS